MTHNHRRMRRITIFTALTAGLALAGCQGDLGFTISEDGDLTMAFEFVDDEHLTTDGVTCDGMKEALEEEPSMALFGTMTVEDVSQGDTLGCRMTFSDSALLTASYVSSSGDTFTFEISKTETEAFANEFDVNQLGIQNLNFTTKVTFPGEVIEASDGGQIDGNTVTWDSYDVFLEGISATGYQTADGAAATPSASPTSDSPQITPTTGAEPGTTPTPTDSSSSSGFPVWGWIVIAVGVLLIVGIVLFAIRRGKNKTGNGPQPGTPTYPGNAGMPGQPYGQSYPGNAGMPGQPYGQPYAGQSTTSTGQVGSYPGYPTQAGVPTQQPQYPASGQETPGQGYAGPTANSGPYIPPQG